MILILIGTDKPDFMHNLLLTNRQVIDLRKAFANSSTKDIKFIKDSVIQNNLVKCLCW